MSGDGTDIKTVLVDSSVWIDLFRGRETNQTSIVGAQLPDHNFITADLVMCEVLRGCRSETEFNACLWHLTEYETVTISDPDLAIRAASNYRSLRGRGITVRSTIDTLIATWCIDNDVWLLHSDRDFDPFEEHLDLTAVH
ncbi:MAG: PIN domain-containing protein [Armatimonadia bacterium]|nr:PIN domain-containing protein [Armatimonadia bacterium]